MKSKNKIVYSLSALALMTANAPLVSAQDGSAVDDAAYAEEISPSDEYQVLSGPANPFEDPKFQEFIEKVFGYVDDTPVDPTRLALADTTVNALMPAGAYSEMINELVEKIARPLLKEIPLVTSSQIWSATGVEIESEIAPDKQKAIAAIIDPGAEKRTEDMVAFGKKVVAKGIEVVEPPLRSGMARAYARKFTAEQLTEMNGFFASPTGAAFASNQMKIQMDPEVLYAVFKEMPQMTKKFESMGKEIEAEAKLLGKTPDFKVSQLNKDKQQELARLLGVSVKELNQKAAEMEAVSAPADYDDAELEGAAAAEGAAYAAAAAAGEAAFPDEDGSEAWYREDSWTDGEREQIVKLSEKFEAEAAAFDATSEELQKVENDAVAAARKRLKKSK